MKLNKETLKNTEFWNSKNVILPKFNVCEMEENTAKTPEWVHFGAGNIFRGFIAKINQDLLNDKFSKTGIVVVDTFDFDIIDKIYRPFDNLTMLVNLKVDGTTRNEIIASMPKSYKGSLEFDDFNELIKVFENKSLQMVSFTITEKGYALKDQQGEFFSFVKKDLENGPSKATHIMSIVTLLLLKRYMAGKYKLALCSMDNCSHNGDKLKSAVLTIATKWYENNFVSKDFLNYIEDKSLLSFPLSMIDKITPRPDSSVEDGLKKLDIEDMQPIITSKNTFIAPFVNAEIPQYLVIEDDFPNGRPMLEKAGVYITDRETVNKTETMKVTTCLNPLHTALAVYGCLLDYKKIYDEIKDEELLALIKKIGYDEGMKVVVDPKIISPEKFIDEVINDRFSNPFIPDAPQRIATDTSQKVGIRYGETIKAYIKDDKLDVLNLTYIPLAIAGWLRYLLAVNDNGEKFELSSDPMLSELLPKVSNLKLGDTYNGEIHSILANENIFGLNLVECGLSDKIEEMFEKLISGKGAVRKTLKEYLK